MPAKRKTKENKVFFAKKGQNSVHNLSFLLTFFDRVGESGGASDENDLDLPAVQSGFFFWKHFTFSLLAFFIY